MSKPKNLKKGGAPKAERTAKGKRKPVTSVKTTTKPQGQVRMNKGEKAQLVSLEDQIDQNLGGFMLVGKALKAIDELKLYREKFKAFKAYCAARWSLSDKYAYRLINAYTCVNKLQAELPKGELLPINESQVRPLLALDADKWVKAWKQVLKTTKSKSITADEVQAVVAKMLGKSGNAAAAKPEPDSVKTKRKLTTIAKLVNTALKKSSNPTVIQLKKVLEKIQAML